MEPCLERFQGQLRDAKLAIAVRLIVDQKCMDLFVLWPSKCLNGRLRLLVRCLNSVHFYDLHVFIEGSNVEGLDAKDVALDVVIIRRLNEL